MRKIVLYLMCINTLLLSLHAEDPYVYHITSITLDNESIKPFTKGVVALDNGSVWIWSPCICCGKKLDDWEVNDEVIISKGVGLEYRFNNPSHSQYVPKLTIDPETQEAFPTIASINAQEEILHLSDGSQWHIGWWSMQWAKSWNVGDRVVVTPDEPKWGNSTHVLFNMNREKSTLNDTSYINATRLL